MVGDLVGDDGEEEGLEGDGGAVLRADAGEAAGQGAVHLVIFLLVGEGDFTALALLLEELVVSSGDVPVSLELQADGNSW